MRAKVGDRIVLAAEQVDRPTRDGEVLEVRGADGGPPYLVRWSDGHTGLIFPGPGSVLRVSGAEEEEPPAPRESAEEPGARHEWTVRISVFSGDDTTANAVLVADPPMELRATGGAHRSDNDASRPRIGDEVAVARALRHLADQLLDAAEHDVEQATGEHDVLITPR